MDHIGIDVHKRDSQIYLLAEGGEVVEQRIRTEGERFAAALGARPRARMLIEASTDPGAGPVTAAAFLAAVDDAQRFHPAHQLEAYLGLVPREYSSGETQRRGPITKAGHSRPRWLLIQAARSILRCRPPAAEALWTWALRIATRRGKHVAVVALARRLAGILYALLRMGRCMRPGPPRPFRTPSPRCTRERRGD